MATHIPCIVLKKGRESSLLRRHPWIFSGAVGSLEGSVENGEIVKILSSGRDFLGWGAYSQYSQISARIWSWNEKCEVNEDFIVGQINRSIEARDKLMAAGGTDAIRLVHGESDGLPGLVIDRYAEWIVVQFLSSGAEKWRREIIKSLVKLCSPRGIYERSDVEVRRLEGMNEKTGLLFGEEPPDRIQITEHGLNYWVDIKCGQKTGFYLDQRRNRKIVSRLAESAEVLDCFCYSGGFSVSALGGGAVAVTGVDTSSDALEQVKANLRLNGFKEKNYSQIEGDVFRVLRTLRDQDKKFDLIVMDPPKFAPTAAQVERAARGYKDINLLAFKLLRPGGTLVTFSCSGGVGTSLFQKIVASAALDARAQARIIKWLHQDFDHPVALNFPEGEYLKGLVVRKE